MCAPHATVRGLIRELTGQPGHLVVDMEAGLEHFSRGTPGHADTLLLVAEPYFKSMETAVRAARLAAELGIPRVAVVANKVRDAGDQAALREFFERAALPVVGVIPADDGIREADRAGQAPLDHDPTSPAVAAICSLVPALEAAS